jgi:MinD-like ATPase involved in chromosome partitioning or flagellar assembly
MVTFDDVLPRLLQVCESFPGFDKVKKAVAVRDLRGQIRLAIQCDVKDLDRQQLEQLEQALARELGGWFVSPVLGPSGGIEQSRVRGTVLAQNEPWRDAAWTDSGTGVVTQLPEGKWHLFERRLSKLAWTGEEKTVLPWPLVKQKPAIVTFYSFKGGVGRTTLLASTAWQLAQEGRRVVAIDLDVEAPGLGSLLGARSSRGVVDFLVDHMAIGSNALDDMLRPASALPGEAAGLLDVVTAGTVDHSYFEKLARLDFVGSGLIGNSSESPVRKGLIALLEAIAKRTPAPDYILLDSRAGLHDVAGLSLNGLAHVNVLVGRDSDQAYQGLNLTIEALGRRRELEQQRCVVVQSMAPDDPSSDEYKRITSEYRSRSYEAFSEHVYSKEKDGAGQTVDLPELDDDSVAHYPAVIRFNQRLLHFSSIETRREELFAEDFRRAKDRILEKASPEPEERTS